LFGTGLGYPSLSERPGEEHGEKIIDGVIGCSEVGGPGWWPCPISSQPA